jgi:hypothetical protein
MKTKLSLDNITVFDQHDTIKKADLVTIYDIWGNAKLDVLQKRKQHKLQLLNSEKRLAAIKHTFILAVKAGEVVLTADLAAITSKLNHITTDQKEQALLLDMNIRSLTAERAAELKSRVATLSSEIVELANKTPKQLWEEDAERFKNAIAHL